MLCIRIRVLMKTFLHFARGPATEHTPDALSVSQTNAKVIPVPLF